MICVCWVRLKEEEDHKQEELWGMVRERDREREELLVIWEATSLLNVHYGVDWIGGVALSLLMEWSLIGAHYLYRLWLVSKTDRKQHDSHELPANAGNNPNKQKSVSCLDCDPFGSMHKYYILVDKSKKKKENVVECLLCSLSYGNFQAWKVCVRDVWMSSVPQGCGCDVLNMEVRGNVKAKVRCFPDNSKHKWPLLPSNKTQNLICNGCP